MENQRQVLEDAIRQLEDVRAERTELRSQLSKMSHDLDRERSLSGERLQSLLKLSAELAIVSKDRDEAIHAHGEALTEICNLLGVTDGRLGGNYILASNAIRKLIADRDAFKERCDTWSSYKAAFEDAVKERDALQVRAVKAEFDRDAAVKAAKDVASEAVTRSSKHANIIRQIAEAIWGADEVQTTGVVEGVRALKRSRVSALTDALANIAGALGSGVAPDVGSIIAEIARLRDDVAIYTAGVDKTAVARDQWKAKALAWEQREHEEFTKWTSALERIADALGWGSDKVTVNTDNIIAAIENLHRSIDEAESTRDRHFDDLTQVRDDLAEAHEFMERARAAVGAPGKFSDFAESARDVLSEIMELMRESGRAGAKLIEADEDLRDLDTGSAGDLGVPLRHLALVFESLHTVVATSSQDWSITDPDAWIYGIVCGWDDALPEVAKARGWTPAGVARLMDLRAVVERVSKL
jgi:hypothetical protein